MKPVIAFANVHDASLCVYDFDTDKVIIVDLEKITRTKHFSFKPYILKEKQTAFIYRALNYLKIHYDIENDFSLCIFKDRGQAKVDPKEVINADEYDLGWVEHHHSAHIKSTYAQSPFENCFAISWDGIGDDCSFYTAKVNAGKLTEQDKWVYDFSRVYNFVGRKLKLLEDTSSWLDLAGKLMGLSAYGKPQEDTDYIIEVLQKAARYKLTKEEIDSEPKSARQLRVPLPYSDTYEGTGKLDDNNKWIDKQFEKILPKEPNSIHKLEKQYHFAYCAQKMLEQSIIELIREKFYNKIVEQDNNLVITGGVGLNVLANQLIRKTFPEFNVFVSSSSSDSGQSFGLLYGSLVRKGAIDPLKKFDTSYGGMPLYDSWLFDKLKVYYEIPTLDPKELSDLITSGKIVGLIQGNHEIGPRALGNRSIICDPSFVEMKDYINANVKFREWYRPFAPICRKEDAPKFFDSHTYEGYELMNYVADIKPEYADRFPSIVHVDGTCRLQTITKEKNELLYEVLGYTEGVLLNTSLNIQGQPILNHLSDAFELLRTTGLDCIIYKHTDGMLYYFDELVLPKPNF